MAGRWIPAFAGMTVGAAGMAGMAAGMVVRIADSVGVAQP